MHISSWSRVSRVDGPSLPHLLPFVVRWGIPGSAPHVPTPTPGRGRGIPVTALTLPTHQHRTVDGASRFRLSTTHHFRVPEASRVIGSSHCLVLKRLPELSALAHLPIHHTCRGIPVTAPPVLTLYYPRSLGHPARSAPHT